MAFKLQIGRITGAGELGVALVMGKSLLSVGWGCSTVLGAVVAYRSRQLSMRYNAWTTGFRERHSQINPPPTPQMRDLNTRMMTWIFRFFGALLFLVSILNLIGVQSAN